MLQNQHWVMDPNFIPETMDEKREPNGTKSTMEQKKMLFAETNERIPSAKHVRLNTVSNTNFAIAIRLSLKLQHR